MQGRVSALLIMTICMLATFPGEECSAHRRIELATPVLFIYGYADKLTGGIPEYWAAPNAYKDDWNRAFGAFNVIDGTTGDAKLVKDLRAKGKIFAYHVSGTFDEKHKTADDFAKSWSEPFENTLGGELPDGFDAICIDEFHSYRDRTEESKISAEALRKVRDKYPDRLVFVSGVWKLGDGGPASLHGMRTVTYDDLLNAANKYADIFILENYQRTGNPQLYLFESMAKNIESRSPGLLRKTIFALYISQSKPFIADDNPKVDFHEFLERQFELIKTNRYTKHMPGIGFWVFYNTKPDTLDKVLELLKKYFQ